ncbi:unnamed protein product [Adineta ricciae]|uniref:PWI domain-containing protein n=1 Tax=Adineta ricciae TaxID=249248 RepID=A0A814NP34_ADIRI|nr:unnamed protein product [Adineta ricciae]
MADAGFFKGTSAEQDSRFANKQKKLLKQMKFPDNIDVKIDSSKINLDVIKPWIAKRLHELLGIEDDVVIEYVFNQLEDKNPDPKMMQINLTGFLGGSKARLFIGELWKFLASAQASPDGIPAELVEMKKQELLRRQEDDRLREIRKREEDSYRQDVKPDIHKSDTKTNSRHSITSRSENGNNAGGYKSRTHHEDERRRPSPKSHRTRDPHSPDTKSRHSDKKPASESKNDHHHHHRHDATNDSHKTSKSRSRSRSPVKSIRKTDSHAKRSSSETSKTSHHETDKSEKVKSKARRRSSSTNSSTSPRRGKTIQSVQQKPTNNTSDVPTETKQGTLNEQVSKSSASKNKRKSYTPSPPRSNKKEPVLKTMGNVEKVKPKRSSSKEIKKTKKRSKRHRSASSDSSSSSRSSSSSSSSSKSKSLASSNSEAERRTKTKKKPQLTGKDSPSRSRSRSTDRHRRSKRKKDNHKHRKHNSHNSFENSCKWEPVNLDRPDRSSKRMVDKGAYNEKKTRRSQQSSSDKEIPCLTTPPKKPRLESQIRVQTPPPSTRLAVENKSENEVMRPSATSTRSNRTERIVVLEDSRKDGADPFASRVPVTVKSSDDDARLKTSDNNNNSSEDETEIDLRERLLREKAIKSMRRRQLSNPNNNNTKPKTTTNDRIVYDLH